MKAIRLTVKNIGIIEDAKIELNKPLILFYGEIRQGKTTILNSVKWVFGGSFPSDIIRRGETEASIRLDLDCGSILRTFYIARDGSTKARPIVFEKSGTQVKDAVAEIKKLLNPFLLDQDYLRNMSELERKKYFVELFSVDTSVLDTQIANAETQAAVTRIKLKAYGDLDLTPVAEPADLTLLGKTREGIIRLHQEKQQGLHNELAKRRIEYQATLSKVSAENSIIQQCNGEIDRRELSAQTHRSRIQELERQMQAENRYLEEDKRWLTEHGQRQSELPMPPAPDTSDIERELGKQADTGAIDQQMIEAQTQKVKYEQFQKNQQRAAERAKDEQDISNLEAQTRELRNKKLAQLKSCGEASGIPGLEFDEAGNFIFEGCRAGMLSTSQIMRLSSLLSALYPEGFGIELIDRAESLGRSIFDFVDRATQQNKTILAAIVGEQPANAKEEVGVFVVENGKVI